MSDDGEWSIPDLLRALREAERQRDFAIAHDRQPYPTVWAYEQACKALRASQAEAGALREALLAVADSWDAWWAAEDEVWTDESRWKRERTYSACNEAHKQARALAREPGEGKP
jgi:hypothetical protein